MALPVRFHPQPDKGCFQTQPDTLRAVLDIKQFGPSELVVTSGAGAAETDEVFRIAGLMEVVAPSCSTFFRPQPPAVHVGRVGVQTGCRRARAAEVCDGQPARA
jgi:hypothetical protein